MPDRPPMSPILVVDDAAGAIDFYVRAFGATELGRLAHPDGRLVHAALSLGGALVMLGDDFPEHHGGKSMTPTALGGSPVTLHLQLDQGVDEAFDRAVAAGAQVVTPLSDQFWGDRFGVLRDPYGHLWSLGMQVREVSPEDMAAEMARAGMGG